MKKQIDLLRGKVNETFLQYLLPSVSATIMISFNYFIDTLCIGQKLGEKGLAALNLAWPVTTALYATGLLLGTGGGALFSAFLAAGDTKRARSIYTKAMALWLILAAAVTLLGLAFLEPLVAGLGGVGELRQGVSDYVKWVLVLAVSYMGECFYTSMLRNDNAPRLAMAGTLLSCSLNIFLDVFFIYVLDWKMAGAALATSLAVTSTVILGLLASLRPKSDMKLCLQGGRMQDIAAIVKVGMSNFLTEIDSGVVTFVYNTVLIQIGASNVTALIAVYGIVVNINTIVLAAINGVSNAMQPLVSANSGAGMPGRVKAFTNLAVKWAFGMSAAFVIVLEWQAEWFVGIFLVPEAGFLQQAAGAIRIVAVSYIMAAVNMILISFFQAIQAAGKAVCFSFMRTLFLPVASVIGGAWLAGVTGVWAASLAVEGITAAVLLVAYGKMLRTTINEL